MPRRTEHAYIEDSDVVFADDQLHVVLGELLVQDDAAAQLRVVVGEDHDGRAIPRNTLFALPVPSQSPTEHSIFD